MSRPIRFAALLAVGLALLTVVAYAALTRVTRNWFELDIHMRSKLAVTAARQGLLNHWDANDGKLTDILSDITRDERILGTRACNTQGNMLARTDLYPAELTCKNVLSLFGSPSVADQTVRGVNLDLREGQVHLSAVPLVDDERVLGFVVLVHDLKYVEQREATTRWLVFAAFSVLSIGAATVTVLAARFAWRDWTGGLRKALSGEPNHEFSPVIRDVRDLVEKLVAERIAERKGGPWSAERLKKTLTQHLHGEQVFILANREPYIHEKTQQGVKVIHPASGLVTALEPVMRACSGVWIAHGSGSADKETVDSRDHVKVPPGEESYQIRRVWLSSEEENGYYYGFSNEGMWPLCHLAHARPTFRSEDWEQYVRVNQKFADALCDEADTADPIVLVQDYHFALAPKMIRERLPHATILTFWHIPWPNAERFGICPWRQQILEGLLGSSIIGFHTQQHCNNFIDTLHSFIECRIDRESHAVIQKTRRTMIRPYPISVEWPLHWLANTDTVTVCRKSVRKELGLPDNMLIGVGVDRLDYTKGIEERLEAVDHLLSNYPQYRGKFCFVQLAAPSRTKIERYQALNDRVEHIAKTINERWGSDQYKPILLLRAHHEPPTVFRYYRAADLCYVSSLHDGMNLVAKEFVGARDDEGGVLILSQFTGAARELTEALIVNPYDLRQAADALASALAMPEEEKRARMASMRRLLAEYNVYRWAGRMLVDAAELRRKDRLMGRLSSSTPLPVFEAQ